jgi:hypothetical protein
MLERRSRKEPPNDRGSFVESPVALVERNSVRREFERREAGTEAHEHASPGKVRQPCDLLGETDRVVQRNDGHRVPDADPTRSLRDRRRVDGRRPRQAEGREMVLRDPDRIEAAGLGEIRFPGSARATTASSETPLEAGRIWKRPMFVR